MPVHGLTQKYQRLQAGNWKSCYKCAAKLKAEERIFCYYLKAAAHPVSC